MKSSTRVAVIGGGVVGCSVLYHLARAGWHDVVLLERSELTSGSTWHAAGGMHTLNSDPDVAALQQYTISLYRELEEASGQSCGLHLTGGVMLAGTPERMDFLRLAHAKGRCLGMDTELVSADEAAALFPLMDKRHFLGGLYDPAEGHVDPAGVTQAYARAARLQGAEVYRHTRVTDTRQRADGTWDVITDRGELHAEHLVNAGGLWAREAGRMVGLELPVLAMEHMYLVTGDMPEVAEINARTGSELLHAIDFEGEIYMRQERGGMLMGTYERDCRPWSERETPWDFDHELLPPDLDRIAPSLEIGFRHFPAFERAGIRTIVNGPFTFAPDGNPLIGPVRGLRNYWVACGVMAGFSQGGGVGLALANWITEGDPGFDVWGMDVARFGDWATMAWTNAKVRENYSRRFRITYPNEELPAGRGLRTTPVWPELLARNAVPGAAFGLEQALWFAPAGSEPAETPTFRRSNAFGAVAAECAAVRGAVGMIEVSGFAKYEVTGAGAEAWLDGLLANRLPPAGRLALTPMLNERGRLVGDFTVARRDDECFMIFGSGPAEHYHMRWFESHLPRRGVAVRALGLDLVGLSIAGPRARELLSRVSAGDVGDAALPFLAIRPMELGMAPALVGRISFTGELGYEIWVRPEFQRTLFTALLAAGEDLGLRLFGARALDSLRLEKSFGTWAREYRPVYDPAEAGLERFVRLDKGRFTGAAALAARRGSRPKRALVTLVIDAGDADAIGDEPVWADGRLAGQVTSGGYAHHAGCSVALAYLGAEHIRAAETGAPLAVEILGERRPARLQPAPLVDPGGVRMRQ